LNPGSVLTELEHFLFDGGTDLKLITLPVSLENGHGSAFAGPSIREVSVDAGNRHLRVIGDFLVDIIRLRLIRCFGSLLSERIVGQPVEILGSYCFWCWDDCVSLSFETGSKLARIGRAAFAGFSSLRSIVIPASITKICGGAFAQSGIRNISIEDGNEHFCVIGQFVLVATKTSLLHSLESLQVLQLPTTFRFFVTVVSRAAKHFSG
jgi:hypothetical protein